MEKSITRIYHKSLCFTDGHLHINSADKAAKVTKLTQVMVCKLKIGLKIVECVLDLKLSRAGNQLLITALKHNYQIYLCQKYGQNS